MPSQAAVQPLTDVTSSLYQLVSLGIAPVRLRRTSWQAGVGQEGPTLTTEGKGGRHTEMVEHIYETPLRMCQKQRGDVRHLGHGGRI